MSRDYCDNCEDLRALLNDAEARVYEVEADLEEAELRADTAEDEVSDLQARVDELEAELEEVQEDVANIEEWEDDCYRPLYDRYVALTHRSGVSYEEVARFFLNESKVARGQE